MKKLLLFCIISIAIAKPGKCQSWTWVNGEGSTSSDIVKYVSIDSSGNSYSIGIFRQSIFSGPNLITSRGGEDFFIAKHDAQGVLQWAHGGGGSSDDGYSMMCETDLAGNTYVAVAAVGNVQFGAVNLNNTLSDIVVLKFDKDGNQIFAKNYGSNSNDVAIGMALDPQGNFYVTGFFSNTINFGSISLPSFGLTDSYLAKFDTNGDPIWAVHGGGSSYDAGAGISLDKFGHVFCTGYYNTSANFGGISLSSSGGDDVYITCYDTNGNIQWAKSGNGGGAYDIGNKIGSDEKGNVYTIGQFQNSITFDTFTLTTRGLNDIFLVKADSSGNFIWAKSYGGKGDDVAFDIDVLDNGSAYFSGYFSDTCIFDASTLISNGGTDLFIARDFTDGTMFWLKQNGGTGDDVARSIRVKNETECYVGGSFSNQVTFDNVNLQSNGFLDLFIGRITAPLSSTFELQVESVFSVYPNPVSSGKQINLSFKNDVDKNCNIEMINGIGSLIVNEKIYSVTQNEKFKIPDVANGIYYLRVIQSNGKVFTSRISIQN